MFKLLLCTCLLSGLVLAEDPKDGMDCKTKVNFTYCEGKSPTYTKLTAVGNNTQETQGGRYNNPLMNKQYGIKEHKCDGVADGNCQKSSTSIFPTLLYNVRSQPRYILQLEAFKQQVLLNICREQLCGRTAFCDQMFANVELLGLDPSDGSAALLVDNFPIPSCCKCKDTWTGP